MIVGWRTRHKRTDPASSTSVRLFGLHPWQLSLQSKMNRSNLVNTVCLTKWKQLGVKEWFYMLICCLIILIAWKKEPTWFYYWCVRSDTMKIKILIFLTICLCCLLCFRLCRSLPSWPWICWSPVSPMSCCETPTTLSINRASVLTHRHTLNTQRRPTILSAIRASALVYRCIHSNKYTLTAYTKYKLKTLNYAYNASVYYSDKKMLTH